MQPDSALLHYSKKVYVPQVFRLQILREHHDDPLAGHFSFARTLKYVQRTYFWPGMRKFIKDYCQTCDICQRIKAPRHKPFGQLTSLPAPQKGWKDLTM